jgi:hypothetical protein
MNTFPREQLVSLKRLIVNYVTALTINVGVIVGDPPATTRATPTPIYLVREVPLVDDCWHPNELIVGEARQVLVVGATDSMAASHRGLISPN